jgi:hypothetical protein
MWELKASACDEFQSEGRVHNILIAPGGGEVRYCVEKWDGGRFFYTILPIGGCDPSSPDIPTPSGCWRAVSKKSLFGRYKKMWWD